MCTYFWSNVVSECSVSFFNKISQVLNKWHHQKIKHTHSSKYRFAHVGEWIPKLSKLQLTGTYGGELEVILYSCCLGPFLFFSLQLSLFSWGGQNERRLRMKWRQMDGEFHRKKAAKPLSYSWRGAAETIRSSQVSVVTELLIYFMSISVVLYSPRIF